MAYRVVQVRERAKRRDGATSYRLSAVQFCGGGLKLEDEAAAHGGRLLVAVAVGIVAKRHRRTALVR